MFFQDDLSCNVLPETFINTELRRKSTNRRTAFDLPRSKLCLNVRSSLKFIYFPRLPVCSLCWCIKNTLVMIIWRLSLSGLALALEVRSNRYLSQFSHNSSFLLIQCEWQNDILLDNTFSKPVLPCSYGNYFHCMSTCADN